MIRILNRYDETKIIYESTLSKSICEAVIEAIKNEVSLREAYLYKADLRNADLYNADLRSANLREAYLYKADLRNANLRNADLRNADLYNADLRDADLRNADLRNVKGINPIHNTDLRLLYDQVGKIRLYKLVTDKYQGPIYPTKDMVYSVGKILEVEKADSDETQQCSFGISLATLPWCIREWYASRRIMVCEFNRKDLVAVPDCTDGKIRVRRCKVIRELDLQELGLIKKGE